jgi:type I restriction enzyme S subunit
MGNIQDGILDWDNLVFTSDKEEISKYALVKGDVLFNRTNSPELVGKTALYNGERPAIFAGYLIRIKCSDKLLPEYLTYCLNSPEGREYCWQVKSDGVSQSNINAKKVAAFKLRIPCIDEQREAVRLIATAFKRISVISTEASNASRQLEKCDGSVLAKAFSGELIAQDPNDEPGAALLARIQSQAATASTAKTKRKRSA